jgi:hypothetical protein
MSSGGKRGGAGRKPAHDEDAACERLLERLRSGGRVSLSEHKRLQRYDVRLRKRKSRGILTNAD